MDLKKQLAGAPISWGVCEANGWGYQIEVIEFIGGEHTPRNLMIRALFTGAKPERKDRNRYEELVNMWKVSPVLSKCLAAEMEYSKDK